jgi:drug/metabolite transporter (DMT)-like permease
MIKLVSLGILSGAFFSATFILNEVMSVGGGHWVWSASLRYFFTIFFLAVIILFSGGVKQLRGVLKLFYSYWQFWTVAGSIGFGGFYALICYSADFSPGWIVAATWQFTVVASLFVFMLFGRSFPGRIWFFSFFFLPATWHPTQLSSQPLMRRSPARWFLLYWAALSF